MVCQGPAGFPLFETNAPSPTSESVAVSCTTAYSQPPELDSDVRPISCGLMSPLGLMRWKLPAFPLPT
jgi:hypothetical protein